MKMGVQNLFRPEEDPEPPSPEITEAPKSDPILEAATELERAREHNKNIQKEVASLAFTVWDRYERNTSPEERAQARAKHARLSYKAQQASEDLDNAIRRWDEVCSEVLGYKLPYKIWD